MAGSGDRSIEEHITQWRASVQRRQARHGADVLELERQLRVHLADLTDIGLAPDEAFALWSRALLNLRLGNLKDGFRDFEQRLRGAITGATRPLPGVEWQPSGTAASRT